LVNIDPAGLTESGSSPWLYASGASSGHGYLADSSPKLFTLPANTDGWAAVKIRLSTTDVCSITMYYNQDQTGTFQQVYSNNGSAVWNHWDGTTFGTFGNSTTDMWGVLKRVSGSVTGETHSDDPPTGAANATFTFGTFTGRLWIVASPAASTTIQGLYWSGGWANQSYPWRNPYVELLAQ
jgi:hypothetical protein